MKVEIWTNENRKEGKERKRIWKGCLDFIPRVGEFITVKEGFCDEVVFRVYHDIPANEVVIILETIDVENGYDEV